MIHLFEDAVNALLDLAELDGTDEMLRSVVVALETVRMAQLEGELPESEMHAPKKIDEALKQIRKLVSDTEEA
jgi:hypothetical protein